MVLTIGNHQKFTDHWLFFVVFAVYFRYVAMCNAIKYGHTDAEPDESLRYF